MLLLTGATGTIGTLLLRRLIARSTPVRVLVRDPRRLGAERVRVQIALGDLGEPATFRHALRGVDTVVHLAASGRDQPSGTIEELDALATWRLVRATEAAGARHFVYASPLGATPHHPARLQRAKALGAEAVATADLRTTTLRCSVAYALRSGWLAQLQRLALLPVVPLAGAGDARLQPIWAQDVADCLLAAIDRDGDGHAVHELAGPDVLTLRELVELVAGRRALAPLPLPAVKRGLRVYERLAGQTALATWTELQLLAFDALAADGAAGAQALGVTPRPVREVLG